jgi:hypothetical protein
MHALRIARTTVAIVCMKRAAKALLARIIGVFALRSTLRSAPRVEGARAVKRRGRTPIMYAP